LAGKRFVPAGKPAALAITKDKEWLPEYRDDSFG
jgi:hypothetical protein